jgi:hypothetical protein
MARWRGTRGYAGPHNRAAVDAQLIAGLISAAYARIALALNVPLDDDSDDSDDAA